MKGQISGPVAAGIVVVILVIIGVIGWKMMSPPNITVNPTASNMSGYPGGKPPGYPAGNTAPAGGITVPGGGGGAAKP